ncbi:MAG: glycosyltransferase family 4 protein [Bacteroidales bacterium]|nr:glycosyltransferase family 4 protein [Bacteroidales bacterium]
MKIGIEAQRIFRKKKHGMDIVAIELIRNLQKIDLNNNYVIFVKQGPDNSCIKETKNFKIIELPGGTYPLWEQFALPKAVEKEKCDILHCTSNTAPLRTRTLLVLTLHDIIYMERLNLFKKGATLYQKFGNLYRRLIVPKIVAKLDKIITVSKFEKNRIADFFKLKSDKLSVVYNGVGKHFVKIDEPRQKYFIKNKYKLPDEFIFFLGNTDPKKNTSGVLKAYELYLKTSSKKLPLVMSDFNKEVLIQNLSRINAENIIDNIYLTGYISNMDLPAIYNQAALFLYPSLRESFGIPVLEAMACGVPVITSNTSSMPEISGEAAFFVNPFNVQEITDAMIKIENDIEFKNQLIQKGFKQAEKFSWEAMAQNVLNIYQEIKLSKQ